MNLDLDPFSIAILLIVGGGFLYAFFYIWRVKRNGIEAEGYISRIVEHESIDSDGMTSVTYDVFVVYTTQEGRQVEGELSNPKNRLSVGDRIQLKYLPGKEKNPVLTKTLQ